MVSVTMLVWSLAIVRMRLVVFVGSVVPVGWWRWWQLWFRTVGVHLRAGNIIILQLAFAVKRDAGIHVGWGTEDGRRIRWGVRIATM